MRPKYISFDQLVKQNKQELLEDEKQISDIEIRLEKIHTDLISEQKNQSS